VNRGSQDRIGPEPQHSSFRAWTRRVSNPRRSPRFRASASGRRGSPAFAFGVPPHLCAFHRSTGHSRPLPTPPRKALGPKGRGECPLPLDPVPFRLRALYAQSFRTTLAPSVLPRLLARSEPGLPPPGASRSSWGEGSFDHGGRPLPRKVAGSGLRPVSKIPHCCLAVESGPFSVPVWPIALTNRRRIFGLGRPSRTQRPNPTQAPPAADFA